MRTASSVETRESMAELTQAQADGLTCISPTKMRTMRNINYHSPTQTIPGSHAGGGPHYSNMMRMGRL